MTQNRQKIVELLYTFIRQRPGFDPGNYSDWKSYQSEMRSVTRDRHDAERLLRQVELMESSIPEGALREAFRAFSGRLSLTDLPNGDMRLDYCTGQYFPTEYRKAVCAVLAQALWDAKRESMPKGELRHNSETGETLERYDGLRAGDWLRSSFRREFGARMANRWFN
jgi:hypothetical protein